MLLLLTGLVKKKNIAFSDFTTVWERDYLVLYKPSTRATMRGQLTRMCCFFGSRGMREIGAAEVQRLVATLEAEQYAAKTIRNVWITLRLVLGAALAQ
jgi:hypothetical protein